MICYKELQDSENLLKSVPFCYILAGERRISGEKGTGESTSTRPDVVLGQTWTSLPDAAALGDGLQGAWPPGTVHSSLHDSTFRMIRKVSE